MQHGYSIDVEEVNVEGHILVLVVQCRGQIHWNMRQLVGRSLTSGSGSKVWDSTAPDKLGSFSISWHDWIVPDPVVAKDVL